MVLSKPNFFGWHSSTEIDSMKDNSPAIWTWEMDWSSHIRMVSIMPALERMRFAVSIVPFSSWTPVAWPWSTQIFATPLRNRSSPPSSRKRRTRCFRISRTPLKGLAKPSRKILRNMIQNCPQSMSCSRAFPYHINGHRSISMSKGSLRISPRIFRVDNAKSS